MISTAFSLELPEVEPTLIFRDLEVNLLAINFLMELLCLSTGRVFQLDL